MKKILFTFICLSQILLSQDGVFYISGETIDEINGGTLDIYMENSVNVYGFQINIDASGLIGDNEPLFGGAYGGSVEDAGFLTSTNQGGLVLAFSLTGAFIPPGEGLLTTVFWDADVLELFGPITLQIDNVIGFGGSALNFEVGSPFIMGAVYGCTDIYAYNYNPEASYDDGSCEYEGCIDQYAINYNPDATIDDGSCDYLGCIEELAINFNPQATIDDGSCYFLSDIDQHFIQNWQGIPFNPMGIYVNSASLDDISLRIGDEIAVLDGSDCVGLIQLTDEITSPLQIFLSEDDPDTPDIDGFISGGNITYKFLDASEQIEVINVNSTLLNGSEVFTQLGFSEVELQVNSIFGCTEINSMNYNPEATVDDGSCNPAVLGCMDPEACNYNPTANIEGDCLYLDCAQICDGSSYIDDCDICDDDPLNDNECYGCMDQWALNFDPSFTIPDNSCDYPNIGDISMDGYLNVNDIVLLVGVVLDGNDYIEYMDFNQDTYLNIIDIVILVDIILNPHTLGCTDPLANNFLSTAIYNDGFCEYSCIDIDGNNYGTIFIGEQEWMVGNLKVTHYQNGDEIPTGFTNDEWSQLDDTETGAFAVYNDDPVNAETYSNLYNGYSVDDDRDICPDGWHVPTDEEWMELEMYLGMSYGDAHDPGFRGTDQGSQLAGNADLWVDGALENNDNFGTTGFIALPGGYRNEHDGSYVNMGNSGYFWSSNEGGSHSAWYRNLYYDYSGVYRDTNNRRNGFSIRCLGD